METGDWLTAVRVARLPLALRAVRGHRPPGVPAARASQVVWGSCGGPVDEISQLISVLAKTGLVLTGRTIRLSPRGRRIATQDHQHGGALLAQALIHAGLFSGQARKLVELSSIDAGTGAMTCPRQLAVQAAPQLVGLLRRLPGVSLGAQLYVPRELERELSGVWALLPERPDVIEDDRKAIGDRGELYSYLLERERASDPTDVLWVARDDESLGYDIADRSRNPIRRIEAKASSSTPPRFILSENEWKVAHAHSKEYEIHFWGGIRLNEDPREEYERLRAVGFPTVYRDLPQLIASGVLTATPTHYRVEETTIA